MSIFDEGQSEGILGSDGIFGMGTNGLTKTPSGTTTSTGEKGAPEVPDQSRTVRAVQLTLQSAGFNIGPTGADNTWGPCTAQALRQYISRRGEAAAVTQFGQEFVNRARSTTGACASGGGTTTGGNGGGAAPGGNGGGESPPPIDIMSTLRSILPGGGGGGGGGGAAPNVFTSWWFWAGLIGVGVLGVFGYMYYKKSKEEEMAGALGAMRNAPALPPSQMFANPGRRRSYTKGHRRTGHWRKMKNGKKVWVKGTRVKPHRR